MNLYFRLFKILLLSLYYPKKTDPYATSTLHFRCWPTDLDLNVHMNNGRYLTIMDLGRFFLMMELSIFWPAVKKKWMPVVASAQIDFKKSIAPFQKFTLETKITSYDEKWFFIEQTYKVGEVIYAIGKVKTAILFQKKALHTSEVLALMEETHGKK